MKNNERERESYLYLTSCNLDDMIAKCVFHSKVHAVMVCVWAVGHSVTHAVVAVAVAAAAEILA
jgi:hypothetical protein